jgi:HEAT repeats
MKASVCRGALMMLFGVLFAGAPTARAQNDGPTPTAAKSRSGKKAGRAAKVKIDVAGLTAKLKSADSAQVQAALDEIRDIGQGAAVLAPQVESLLRAGAGAELTEALLETLGALRSESSSAVIRPYTRHRTKEIRVAAIKALTRTGGSEAVAALRAGLSDADPAVRNAAAGGLGTLKSKEAIGDLFAALDHKVLEAAAAIGKLCSDDECERFAAKTGAFDFEVMTSGFDPILFRPASEVSEDEKIRIVGRIREVGTADANKYLRDVQSRWPDSSPPRLKRAIEQAVEATGGGTRQ